MGGEGVREWEGRERREEQRTKGGPHGRRRNFASLGLENKLS